MRDTLLSLLSGCIFCFRNGHIARDYTFRLVISYFAFEERKDFYLFWSSLAFMAPVGTH